MRIERGLSQERLADLPATTSAASSAANAMWIYCISSGSPAPSKSGPPSIA